MTQELASADLFQPASPDLSGESQIEGLGLASHQSYASLRFEGHPADTYTGSPVLPDFNGAQRDYAAYRTRLNESAQAGVNFAGHFAVSQIGCGMQCSFVNIIDLKNGQIHDFPLGGEESLELELSFRPHSALILARHLEYSSNAGEPNCRYKSYVWTGRSFEELTSAIAPGRCSA